MRHQLSMRFSQQRQQQQSPLLPWTSTTHPHPPPPAAGTDLSHAEASRDSAVPGEFVAFPDSVTPPTSPMLSPTQTIHGISSGSTLQFADLFFSIHDGERTVLNNLSGRFFPGELCAILSESGAGKTALLSALSGRLYGNKGGKRVRVRLSIDGVQYDPRRITKQIAFVAQEDALIPFQTPREVLYFSARMRLPAKVSNDACRKRAEAMLEELRLVHCADTLIGSPLLKGLSGGEKRRTSIGQELITDPAIIFLDEPTSGLDSAGAFNVAEVLAQLAQSGCTVVLSIHQPSGPLFALFDKVVFMSPDGIVFWGPPDELPGYLAKVGIEVAPNSNPADSFMFELERAKRVTLLELSDAWLASDEYRRITGAPRSRRRRRSFPRSTPAGAVAGAPAVDLGAPRLRRQTSQEERRRRSEDPRVSVPYEVYLLCQREARTLMRDTSAMWSRFVLSLVGSTVFGIVFFGSGSKSSTSFVRLQAHFGAVCLLAMTAMLGLGQSAILSFPLERHVFLRDVSTGTYRATSYFIAKSIFELPLMLLQASGMVLVSYFLIELQGDFLVYCLTLWLLGLSAASTSMFIGALAPSSKAALEAAPAAWLIQILFSGVFLPSQSIPIQIRWGREVSPLHFALSLLLITEFERDPNAQILLTENNVKKDQGWMYVTLLVLIHVGLRLIAAIVLTRRAHSSW